MFCGSLVGFMSFGYVTSSILGFFVVRNFPDGWRYVAMITALPVVMLLWWRRSLPESARWLESRGRVAEAEAVVAGVEREFVRRGHVLTPIPATVAAAPGAAVGFTPDSALRNVLSLWSRRLAPTTSVAWIMWFSVAFSYYAFFSWIPSLLIKHGMTITQSFSYSIAIYASQIPGYFSAAYLNEKLGRKGVVASYMMLGGVSAVLLAFSQSELQIMLSGMSLSFFMNGAFAGVYAYTPEIFPTSVRATGTGSSSSFGRIGSVSAPILVGYIYPQFGFGGVFGMTTFVLLAGAVVVLLFGIQTKGRSLEEIEAAELGDTHAAPGLPGAPRPQ
jgi:putative MFS transporter